MVESDFLNPEALNLRADLSVEGSGVNVVRKGLGLNPSGLTTYRIEEDQGPVDKFSFEALVLQGNAEFSLHTWLSTGKHLGLVEGKKVTLGETYQEKITVERDGEKLELNIAFRFYQA